MRAKERGTMQSELSSFILYVCHIMHLGDGRHCFDDVTLLLLKHRVPYHVISTERRWVSGSRWIKLLEGCEKGTSLKLLW